MKWLASALATCLIVGLVASCSGPQDPTLAFLERHAEAPFERIHGLVRHGDHYRWRTPLYERRFGRLNEEEDSRRALGEMMVEVAAFAGGAEFSYEDRFARLCIEAELEARERYYFLPIEAVRPGARKHLAKTYRRLSDEGFRENSGVQRGPPWPPTHGPYLKTSWVAPLDPAAAPLTRCLTALFRFSPQSDAVQSAALARAEGMERRALDAAASMTEVMQLGPGRLVAGKTYEMEIVFYSAENGWAQARFVPDLSNRGRRAQGDSAALARATRAEETMNAQALKDCGFSLNGGGGESLWEPLCRRAMSDPEDDLSEHMAKMEAFVDQVLASPDLIVSRRSDSVQPREEGA